MMKQIFFPLAFLVSLLAGCHNTDPTTGTTTVSGQVVVYQNATRPVPNASVQLYRASAGGGYVPVGSPYPADATGHFAFDFDAPDTGDYLLLASAPPGYTTDWALAPYLTTGRRNENLRIQAYAPAWVKLQLVNASGRKRHEIDINGYSGSGEIIRYPKDTVFIRRIFAIKTSISWGIIDEATGATSQDYLYVQPAPLDTVNVRIPF